MGTTNLHVANFNNFKPALQVKRAFSSKRISKSPFPLDIVVITCLKL